MRAAGTLLCADPPRTPQTCTSWSSACAPQTALAIATSGKQTRDQTGCVPSLDQTGVFPATSGIALYGGFNGTKTAFDQRHQVNNVTVPSGDVGNEDTTDAGQRSPVSLCVLPSGVSPCGLRADST